RRRARRARDRALRRRGAHARAHRAARRRAQPKAPGGDLPRAPCGRRVDAVTRSARTSALAAALLLAAACGNNPYPGADDGAKVGYGALSEPPKTLDPAVSYSTIDHVVIANVQDTLLEYHYLKRPFELIPGLAEAVPEPRELPGGRVSYRFRL